MSAVQVFCGLLIGWAMIAGAAAALLGAWCERTRRLDGAAHDERPLRRARR